MGGWDVSPWCFCCHLRSCCHASCMSLNYFLGMVMKMEELKVIKSSPFIQTNPDTINPNLHLTLRQKIREAYGIDGCACWDEFCVLYCTPYALVQERNQLKKKPIKTVSLESGFLLPPNWMQRQEEDST